MKTSVVATLKKKSSHASLREDIAGDREDEIPDDLSHLSYELSECKSDYSGDSEEKNKKRIDQQIR